MSFIILILFFIALLIRLLSLFISIRNENYLKLSGAFEYGKTNSIVLMVSHSLIYLFCFIEAYSRQVRFDIITVIGMILLSFSAFMLFIIINKLKRLWTFKLYIAKNHILDKSFLFKRFKHPNYFFNVIPELLSVILICKAWIVLVTLFPIHLIFLATRIRQENAVMKAKFPQY